MSKKTVKFEQLKHQGSKLKDQKFESIQREGFKRIFAGRRRGFSLRMAPMMDMIFLLLIFFLVTAKWRPEENFLPFQLPTAQAAQGRIGKPEPLIIYIFPTKLGCAVQIAAICTVEVKDDCPEADLALLMKKIKDTLVLQKRFAGDPVEIICQPKLKWEHLAEIYNMFFGAGLTDITFRMTEQMENEE